MAFHVAQEETLDRQGLIDLQRAKLARLLTLAKTSNPFYQRKLDRPGFDSTVDALKGLPLTTRAELERDQSEHPPYGTNLSFPIEHYTRMHQTSGSTGRPMRWVDTRETWEWCRQCWAIVYRAAGVEAADRIVFPFAFGPFLGFWLAFEAAGDLGNFHLAAGGMTTSARLRLIRDHAITVVCCTPTYALHMAETAAAEGVDLAASTVRKLIVAGEPGGNIPAVRRRIEEAWGARVFDHAGMTEMGAWGFECEEAPGGMHAIESQFIPEILDPRTQAPVPDGEPGELVLTNLGRVGSPLIRYRTGDQAILTRGRCACGRSFARVEGGILGRIDDMLVIRGNNVFPSAVEGILREFPEVAEFRLRPISQGAMTELEIDVEPAAHADEARLAERVTARLRDRLNFRPDVRIVAPGTLPRFEMKARRVANGEQRC